MKLYSCVCYGDTGRLRRYCFPGTLSDKRPQFVIQSSDISLQTFTTLLPSFTLTTKTGYSPRLHPPPFPPPPHPPHTQSDTHTNLLHPLNVQLQRAEDSDIRREDGLLCPAHAAGMCERMHRRYSKASVRL